MRQKDARNDPANTKVREGGGRGGSPGASYPAAHGQDHDEADSHTAAHGGFHVRGGGYFPTACGELLFSTVMQTPAGLYLT